MTDERMALIELVEKAADIDLVREMRRKGLWPTSDAPVFLPVEMTPALAAQAVTEQAEALAEITVVLRNGRQLRCSDGIGDAALARLVRLLETA